MDHLDASMDGEEERSGFETFLQNIGKVWSSYPMFVFLCLSKIYKFFPIINLN